MTDGIYAGELIRKSPYPEWAAKYYPNPENTIFKIVSQTGTKYFEEVLANNCQIMWTFLEKLSYKNKQGLSSFNYRELKKYKIEFNIAKKYLA